MERISDNFAVGRVIYYLRVADVFLVVVAVAELELLDVVAVPGRALHGKLAYLVLHHQVYAQPVRPGVTPRAPAALVRADRVAGELQATCLCSRIVER